MFTLINYLKSYENKLSETEQSETQFLDRDTYTSETFNLNSFTKIIMGKIKDTSNLITLLNKNIAGIKNEILTQINSNFNNHIVLISKIQTVDFLIDNIEKPLAVVKQKIQNKIDLISKNEEELKEILEFLIDNDKILHNAKISFNYFKLLSQSNQIKNLLEKKHDSNILKNIIENNENVSLLSSYEFIKAYLIENFRILTLNQKIKNITDEFKRNFNNDSQKISCDKVNQNSSMKTNINNILSIENAISVYNKIQTDDENRYLFLDKLLEICLLEIIEKINDENLREALLYKHLLDLLFKCYNSQFRVMDFFEKIKVSYFITEINDIFSKEINSFKIGSNTNKFSNSPLKGNNINLNNTIEKRIKIFENILNTKYKFLFQICESKKIPFNLICLMGPLFSKLNSEKHIFNCIDPEIFRNNLNSIFDFIDKYKISNENYDMEKLKNLDESNLKGYNENLKKELFENENYEKEKFYCYSIKQVISAFLQNFSFFTYFQFLQIDLTKIFLNNNILQFEIKSYDVDLDNRAIDLKNLEEIKISFFGLSNFLFNFNKTFEAIFKEKKLFLKILSNFLSFILSSFNFMGKKQFDYFSNMSLINFLSSKHLDKNNLEINEKLNSLKSNFGDYLKNLNNHLLIIYNFEDYMLDVVKNEIFLFNDIKELQKLIMKIKKICNNLKENKSYKELVKCTEFKNLLISKEYGIPDKDKKTYEYLNKFMS